MSTELLQVVTTTADQADAEALAKTVLTHRLAACVQIQGPIDSHYWWNGRLERTSEWRVVMKTHAQRFSSLELLLQEEHPYDEPEIIATAAEHVSAGYLHWLKMELQIE